MEDDDVGIAGGSRSAGKRGDCPHGKALLRQLESATGHAVLDEKYANGVVRLLADGGNQHGRACLQGHDSSIEPSLPVLDVPS